MSDVGAVEEVVALDAGHIAQRRSPCLGQRRATSHDEQHAASGRQNPVAVGFRAHMVDRTLDLVEPLDLMTLLIAARVPLRGEHDAQCGTVVPLKLRVAAVGHGTEDIDDVALQARQHNLRLGIAETGIELDHLDAVGRLHQPP